MNQKKEAAEIPAASFFWFYSAGAYCAGACDSQLDNTS